MFTIIVFILGIITGFFIAGENIKNFPNKLKELIFNKLN